MKIVKILISLAHLSLGTFMAFELIKFALSIGIIISGNAVEPSVVFMHFFNAFLFLIITQILMLIQFMLIEDCKKFTIEIIEKTKAGEYKQPPNEFFDNLKEKAYNCEPYSLQWFVVSFSMISITGQSLMVLVASSLQGNLILFVASSIFLLIGMIKDTNKVKGKGKKDTGNKVNKKDKKDKKE